MSDMLKAALAAAFSTAAPVPEQDPGTREDWRQEHKFLLDKYEQKWNLLPSEAYFLGSKTSPFEADGKTELRDKAALREELVSRSYNNYIIRNKGGEIIATAEDYKLGMNVNLDRPNIGISISNEGLVFGNGCTVENLRTGVVTTDGIMPYDSSRDKYRLNINAHSAGYLLDIAHANPAHDLTVEVLKGGPGNIQFAENAAGVNVILNQDKSEELKETHHQIALSSSQAKTVAVKDWDEATLESPNSHNRQLTFASAAGDTKIPASLTIVTNDFSSNPDKKANHTVDFHVVDQVRYAETVTPNKLSYIIGEQPELGADEFARKLHEAAKKVSLETARLRKDYGIADAVEAPPKTPVVPPVPMQPLKSGGMEK